MSWLGAPGFVTLQDSIVSVAGTSTQSTRSAFFQVVMTDGSARRDTAFYHVVDMSKPLDPLVGVAPSVAQPPRLAMSASPQPSRGTVAIAFATPTAGEISLAVHDLAGRRIRTLALGWRAAGDHLERWDGRDDLGRAVAPGLYWAKLIAPAGNLTATIVRTR